MQRDQEQRLRCERQTAKEVWADLTAFCERVRSRLDEATLAERQRILQLLIERVIVGEDALEIRHVIPLGRLKAEPVTLVPAGDGGEGQTPAGPSEEPLGAAEPRLRSDGVGPADLPGRGAGVGREAVADDDRADRVADQRVQPRRPRATGRSGRPSRPR